jgi:hypothetical protein
MKKSTNVETTINDIVYIGRFLGFLKDDEYQKMVGNPIIASRIESKEGRSLLRTCSKLEDEGFLHGVRFVIALRKRANKSAYKNLLISERLSYISEVRPEEKQVEFCAASGNGITLIERED